MSEGRDLFVLVTVGTDHHPFDRLIRWVDDWIAEADVNEGMRCFVQTGTSTPPRFAEWKDYVGYEELETALREATIVVSHGGTGSIMLCRYLGKKPIVVPRRQHLGEHVDDHQVAFAKRMAARGDIELARGERHFRETMDRAAAAPERLRLVAEQAETTESVRRFQDLVGALIRTRIKRSGAVLGPQE